MFRIHVKVIRTDNTCSISSFSNYRIAEGYARRMRALDDVADAYVAGL